MSRGEDKFYMLCCSFVLVGIRMCCMHACTASYTACLSKHVYASTQICAWIYSMCAVQCEGKRRESAPWPPSTKS